MCVHVFVCVCILAHTCLCIDVRVCANNVHTYRDRLRIDYDRFNITD